MLQGKKAIVTGGGRGIGRAIALALAGAGAEVLITYSKDEGSAAEVQKRVESDGGRASTVRFDALESGAEDRLADDAEGRLGQIDILVNNAGRLLRTPFVDVATSELDQILHVNLRSPFVLTQAVARRMIKRGVGGSIVNVSSISASTIAPKLSHYQCAKAGLSMLTKGAALELAMHNIRVNAIEPGLVATDINRDQWDGALDVWKARCARIPLGRAGAPSDCAPLVVLLASDAGAWITGSCFVVDGGLTLVGGPGTPTTRATA